MSYLIEALQEVELEKEKSKQTESDKQDLEVIDIIDDVDSTSSFVLDSDSSEQWENEFLPEFAESLSSDSSDDEKSHTEKHYYDQSLEEFLENSKSSESNENISATNPDIYTDFKEELETSQTQESGQISAPEFESSNFSDSQSDLESLVETMIYDEDELIKSTKFDSPDNEEKTESATVVDLKADVSTQLLESLELESDDEILSNLPEIQTETLEENPKDDETSVQMPDNPVDETNLLKENQYVLSAQTLMTAHRANRKKWVYSLLFVLFLGIGGLVHIYYDTIIALQSGTSDLSSEKSGGLSWKRPKSAVSDEKNSDNENLIETASAESEFTDSVEDSSDFSNIDADESELTSSESEKVPESEVGIENPGIEDDESVVEKRAEIFVQIPEFQGEMSPVQAEPVSEMAKVPFSPFPSNDYAFQKVAQTAESPAPKTAQEPEKSEENEGIKVIRKNKPRYLNANLSKAYTAFQRGDDENARTTYHAVLQQDPKNRDALLGLAAIALRNDDFQKAQKFYQDVLAYYPQDKVAQVGLMAAQSVQMPEETESYLKFLLSQSPTAAFIHFSLANFYAQHERWAEAQQAYAQAFKYDNQRADYAYNLAVSLEHLQQKQAALQYYRQALYLSQFQAVNFEIKAIEQRLLVLENSIPSNR